MNYELSTIQNAFFELVTFKKDFTTDELTSDLIQDSLSGLYYNDARSLITLKLIYSMIPNTEEWSISAYSVSVTYTKDDLVEDSGKYYISLQNNNEGNAVTDTAFWKETTLKSAYLTRFINNTIQRVISRSIQTKYLIDQARLYAISNDDDVVENNSSYVGFEIFPGNSENLKVVFNQIGLQFSEVNTDLTFHLYKGNTEVKTFTASSLEKDFSWTDLTDTEISGQNRWFLFYDQDDLNGQAYNWNFYAADMVSNFVKFRPFEVVNTTTDFINDVDDISENSFGLGLNISVMCDLTEFITQNRLAFSEAVQLQFAYDILELFLNNPEVRSNRDQRLVSANEKKIQWELNSEDYNSLTSQLNRTYDKLGDSLSFDTVCLPCQNEPIITYTSQG